VAAGVAAACLFAALWLGLPASADAKAPRKFYGVVSQTELGQVDFDRMGRAKVGTLRAALIWSAIDPSAAAGDYQWGAFDALVEGAARHHIHILPTVYATPGWVSEREGCKPDQHCVAWAPRSKAGLRAWRDFLRAAVSRYGPDGGFWSLNPTVPKLPIRDWQIWNEQNSPTYFTPKPNVDVYERLVTEASRAIKAVDRGADVILGGMFATPLGGQRPAIASYKYLRALYAHQGFAARFDGVGVHPYARSMENVKLQVNLLRDEMARAHDSNTGIWITEIGWASAGADNPLVVGAKDQARHLRQSFAYYTKHRRKLNIRQIDWFSWRDAPPGLELCSWCPKSGLFTRQPYKPKPAYRAFVKFTGGR